MSKVKQEYATYFTSEPKRSLKYSFEEEKLKRDFPEMFGIEDDSASDVETINDWIESCVNAVNHEIIEEKILITSRFSKANLLNLSSIKNPSTSIG